MASIVLGAVGTALGAAAGIPFGSFLGGALGRQVGGIVDNAILPDRKLPTRMGPRLVDLAIQTSTYGTMIPIVYGNMRLGGNIIWAQPIKETVSTTTSSIGGGGKGGGGKVTQTSTAYSYSVTLAIGICEGPIDGVLRIWADARQLDLSQFTIRIYNGNETQTPDTLIQSLEGADKTPAYRGLAYVVIEDFPLADYGNRIPNFTFEVKRKLQASDYNGEILEDLVTGMTMIPGAGEFVYDTQVEYKVPGVQSGSEWSQVGSQQAINMQNANGVANALLSLDQLQETCPNVEWVSVVVTWFGTSMDAGACEVFPGVEYQTGAITLPDSWQVGSFTRSTAHLITQISGAPQYGGTPDDDSILRYLDELAARGYKIIFYPLMFMDVSGKPWRGDVTGSAANVSSFFTKTNGFNAFITHYANLVTGKVDAFVIGSELKGLTKVTDTPGNYPAVNQLVSLAATVKATLGSSVKITYAADWSEYHHTDGGWYHMDPLWSSPNIDMVGIDAYFPLTNIPQAGYDVDAVIAGWTSGEGYDWYYTDPARTVQASLAPAYAWKNIAWFWNNTHTNPGGGVTAWTPQMKKIWFTEYGFASVDGATNQPNVFYDPSSTSGALPYFSKGRVDFRAQRVGHMATQQQWKASSMVEQMFIWTWDARPYPYWPDLTNVWTDGGNWSRGHWVQGKFGISSLSAIISDLGDRVGLGANDIDLARITDLVEGFIISEQQTIRTVIETLQQAYFFDVVESDNKLKYIPRGGEAIQAINDDDIVPPTGTDNPQTPLLITRTQEVELPKRVNVVYVNRLLNYQASAQYSQREVTSSLETVTLDMPIVLSEQSAKNIADITLFTNWVGRTNYQFDLPVKYFALEPSDVITVAAQGFNHRMRITGTHLKTPGLMRVQAVAEDVSTFDFYSPTTETGSLIVEPSTIPVTALALLDIPAFPGDDNTTAVLRAAAAGVADGWVGSALYRSDDNGANYNRLGDIPASAVLGTANNALASSNATNVFDEVGNVSVVLLGDGELSSTSELAVLNGANAALLGDEIIQFKTATLTAPGKYTLSGLLRGRLGTEWAISTHAAGERFVLLDGRLFKQSMGNNLIGLLRQYKAVSFGSSLADTSAQSMTYNAVSLKPYAPVHITGTRDGSGNLTLNWIRRSRLGGQWQDNVDVPLNETSESYQIDILNGTTVVRTINANTPTASYSAVEQTADFGSVQVSVSVKAYQLSGVVGRGYAGVATV